MNTCLLALSITQRNHSLPILCRVCTTLSNRETVAGIESSVFNGRAAFRNIDSWMVPEMSSEGCRKLKVVVANQSRRVYLYIKLSCVARTIHQLMLDGRFRATDSILIIPKTWPHVPGFERYRFATRLSEVKQCKRR